MRVPAQQHSTARLDRPGNDKLIQLYQNSEPNRWKDFVSVISSKQGFERVLQYGGFGNAGIVNAGQAIETDDWQTPYYKDITPKKRGILYFEASEVGETDQTGVSKKVAKGIALAFLATKEAFVADFFNNMTATGSAYLGPDSKPLIATDHPNDTGTWTNRPATDIAFSALALEQAIQELAAQENHRGEAMPAEGPFDLHIPIGLMGVANRVVKASGLAQSASNDPNWAGGMIRKICWNPRYTSSTAWGLKDIHAENLVLVQRRPIKTKAQEVIEKDGEMRATTEIYGAAVVNQRGFWGTTG